jgi:hypothetical protein
MRASEVWPALEFRFTEPVDVELYGGGWYRYSEGDLIRKPARELVELEGQLGMPIVDVMNGARMRTLLGNLAAAWIGVRAAEPDLAGDFDDFSPLIMLVDWRPAEGKAEAGTEPEPAEPAMPEPPATGSPDQSPSRPASSAPTDSVALPTSPVVD